MSKIFVLVKQIPDPTLPGSLDSNYRYVREGKIVLDEADLYGVEIALQLNESLKADEVVAISMAPNGETSGVRTALAMGVDRALIVSDNALENANALATAKVLNAAIDHVGDCMLVVSGVESSDGYSGTVPMQIAALRRISALSFATSVQINGSTLTIRRQSNDGIDVVSGELPAVLSVTAGVVEPRYPNFKGIMAAKSKPCDVVSLNEIGVDSTSLAIDTQSVLTIEDAPNRESGVIINDQEEGAERIIEFLEAQGVL